jgi:hypothetical protein
MQTEDTIVLLAADPATAYREYLYRPRGRFARWINDWFEVVGAPGQRVREPTREGDILLDVTLGRAGRGRCITIAAGWQPLELSSGLPPGWLLLRPRRQAQLSQPLPVEPTVDITDQDVVYEPDGWITDPATGDFPTEHDFGEQVDADTHLPLDTAAAVPPFDSGERSTVTEPLLSTWESAKAVAWTNWMHPAVSSVTVGQIRTALSSYIDAAAVQAAINRQNRRESGEPIDAARPDTDAVLVECVHQFQVKCYCDRRQHDGLAGESTLDSLGLIVRSGSGFRGADRGNATALKRLHSDDYDERIKVLSSDEFSAANWFDAMVDPSVFGWRTKLGNGLHVLLVRRLRQAERHLLTLPAFRGLTPAALGAALRVTEAHGGARPSQAGSLSMHTFGLAIDIAYRANPWIHDATSWRAMRRAALLVSGISLIHDNAPAYFSALGSDPNRSTGNIWDELQQRNGELAAYFKLGEDAPALRAALQTGQVRGTAGLLEQQESADQAAARWHGWIEQDRESLAGADFRHHGPPGKGFLTHPRDLVIALRDHACLAWGAVDLGPGSRGSGDIMHFDARVGGVGQLLARGINFVPTAHPCLTKPARATLRGTADDTEAEAVVDAAPQVVDYLGGKLWTFEPETYALPVAVFCPKATLSRDSVEVLLFAHGLLRGCPRLSQVPAGFVTDAPFALGAIMHAAGQPMVLVVPLLDWACPGGEYAFAKGHEHWHGLARPDRLNRLLQEVLAEVGRVRRTAAPAVTSLVVAGHSRAYDFLEPLAEYRQHRAMRQGPLAKLSQVWAFDTTYAGRVDNWVDWVNSDPQLRVNVYYRPESKTGDVGEVFRRRRTARFAVTPVGERHCDVPATRLTELLDHARGRTSEPVQSEAEAFEYAHEAVGFEAEVLEAEALESEGEAIETQGGAIEAEEGDGGATQAGASVIYWPKPSTKRVVELVGYKFDFIPSGPGGTGTIEGNGLAWRHTGKYELLKNEPGMCQMKVMLGNDSAHSNDLDVILTVQGRNANVRGTAFKGQEREIKYPPDGEEAPLQGAGTTRDPFNITYANKRDPKNPVTIRWPV